MTKGASNKNLATQQTAKGKHQTGPRFQKKLGTAGGSGTLNQNTNQTTIHGEVQPDVQAEAAPNKSNPVNKIEGAESDGEKVEAKQKQTSKKDSNGSQSHLEKLIERSGRGGGRFIIKNLWDVCCNGLSTI